MAEIAKTLSVYKGSFALNKESRYNKLLKIIVTMKKMHISFIKDLRNAGFAELFNSLAILIEKEETTNVSFLMAVERIKSHRRKLILLRNTKLRHHLTPEINQKVSNRTEYLACLRMNIEADLLSPKPERRIAAARLKLWLRPYRKDIHKPGVLTQGQIVKFLMSDRDEQPAIQKASTLLDLDELLEIIMTTTTEIDRDFIERNRDITYRSINGKEVRETAYKDLQLLINVMEVSYSFSTNEAEKEQLVRLSGVINEYLKNFRTEFKSRNTKRKNKKVADAAVKELISDQLEEKTNLPMVIYDELKILRGEELAGKYGTPVSYKDKRSGDSISPGALNNKDTEQDLRISQWSRRSDLNTPYPGPII